MQIVGVLAQDPALLEAVTRFRDPLGRFHLHPINGGDTPGALAGLAPLEFAGALLLGPRYMEDAWRAVTRRSVSAQEARAVDTVTVAGGQLIGEYSAGRALTTMLAEAGWDGRGARAVLLGAGDAPRAIARELTSLGLAQLTVVAQDRPAAEQTLPAPLARTRLIATTAGDSHLPNYLASADLIVREARVVDIPYSLLGPHLCVIDLLDGHDDGLLDRAAAAAAPTFSSLHYRAHLLALGLSQILGAKIQQDQLYSLLQEA